MSDIIEPLRFFNVQKVLPAVYGDELSYYELLAKMEQKINEEVGSINDQNAKLALMQKAIDDFTAGGYKDDFEEFLDTWFAENLDTIEQYLQDGFGGELDEIRESVTSSQEQTLDTVADEYVPFPVEPASKYGTDGQVLRTNGDGTTLWQAPLIPTDQQAETYISAWLNDHPEATTTVQDGSLTTAKYANNSITDEKLIQSGGVLDSVSQITGNQINWSWEEGCIYKLNVSPIDLTPSQGYSSYKCLKVPCVKGDRFVISGGSYGQVASLYAFVAADGTNLFTYPANNSAENLSIIAPSRAAFLLVNWYKGNNNVVSLISGTLLVDVVAGIQEYIAPISTTIPESEWSRGSIIGTTGEFVSSNTRLRARLNLNNSFSVSVESGYVYSLFAWDTNGTFMGVYDGSVYRTNANPIWLGANNLKIEKTNVGDLYIIMAHQNTAETILPSEYANLTLGCKTDASLSISGAPADAKTVGDAVNELDNSISDLNESVNDEIRKLQEYIPPVSTTIPESEWSRGGIIGTTGEFVSSNTRLRARLNLNNSFSVSVESGYVYSLFAWDTNGTFMGAFDGSVYRTAANPIWLSARNLNIEKTGVGDLYVVMAHQNTAETITPSEYANLTVGCKTDVSLSISGAPADAKTVGDSINELNDAFNEFVVNNSEYHSNSYYTSNDSQALVTTYAGVVALYDELVSEHPNYVSKNTLTDGSFSNYEYVFSMGNYNQKRGQRAQDPESNKPLVLIMSGVHGYERMSVMGLYVFARALCESPTMSWMRESFRIKVIPIVTPSSYDNNSRVNSNGVNINRNFDARWTQTPTGSDYSGESPADQPETRVVQDWMDNNTSAILMVDWHNSGFTNEVSYFAPCANFTRAAIAKKGYFDGIAHIVGHWVVGRNITGANTIYGYTGTNIGHGMTTDYADKIGMAGALVETSWNVASTGKDSNFSLGVNAEAFCAAMNGVLNELS